MTLPLLLLARPRPSASVSCILLLLPPSRVAADSSGGSRGPGRTLAPEGRPDSGWRVGVSSFFFLPPFLTGKGENGAKTVEKLKEELLAAIAPLGRGAAATLEDKERVEQIVRTSAAGGSEPGEEAAQV